MDHTKKQAKRFLRLILATKDRNILLPFVAGQLTSDICLVNMKPRMSHSTLHSGLRHFETWEGGFKAPPATDKATIRQPVKGFVTLQGTTLVVKSDQSPEHVHTLFRKYFVAGLKQQVPWKRADGGAMTEQDTLQAGQAPAEEALLAGASEESLQGAVTALDAEDAAAVPPAPPPALPPGSEAPAAAEAGPQEPAPAAPRAASLLREFAAPIESGLLFLSRYLPGLGAEAGPAGPAQRQALSLWIGARLGEAAAAQREEVLHNSLGRFTHQLPYDQEYALDLRGPGGPAASAGEARSPLLYTKTIDLREIGPQAIGQPEVVDTLGKEVTALAHRQFSLYDLAQSTTKPLEAFVSRNWLDGTAPALATRNAAKLRDEVMAIVANSAMAIPAMLGISKSPLPEATVREILQGIEGSFTATVGRFQDQIDGLIAAVESQVGIREAGGVSALGGSWGRVEALRDAFSPPDLASMLAQMRKDPRLLPSSMRKLKDQALPLGDGFAQQLETPPAEFGGAPSGFCQSTLKQFASLLRVA